MPSKRKKRGKKSKRSSGEERKQNEEVKTVEILLSAHTRTLEANILHWDQKATKCTTCKRLCGKFSLFIGRQWPENGSTSLTFKTPFLAKFSGG